MKGPRAPSPLTYTGLMKNFSKVFKMLFKFQLQLLGPSIPLSICPRSTKFVINTNNDDILFCPDYKTQSSTSYRFILPEPILISETNMIHASLMWGVQCPGHQAHIKLAGTFLYNMKERSLFFSFNEQL